MRSYGLLKYAAKMNTQEAMSCLSFLLLGVSMGMISCCSPAALGNLMMDIMPGMLAVSYTHLRNSAVYTDKHLWHSGSNPSRSADWFFYGGLSGEGCKQEG